MKNQNILSNMAIADTNYKNKNWLEWNLILQDKLTELKLRSLEDLLNKDLNFCIKIVKMANKLKLI